MDISDVAARIMSAESAGDPNARNNLSSATGLGQFIERTWLAVVKKHRPDLLEGRSRAEVLALRTDPAISAEMTQRYAEDNAAALRNAGIEPSPAALYLAHFAGPGRAIKIMKSAPDAPISSVFGQNAVKANPFLKGLTISELVAWAARKMKSAKPATVTPAATETRSTTPPESSPVASAPEPSPIVSTPEPSPIVSTPEPSIAVDIPEAPPVETTQSAPSEATEAVSPPAVENAAAAVEPDGIADAPTRLPKDYDRALEQGYTFRIRERQYDAARKMNTGVVAIHVPGREAPILQRVEIPGKRVTQRHAPTLFQRRAFSEWAGAVRRSRSHGVPLNTLRAAAKKAPN
ncbi:MAG: hypothetical protein D6773_09980, partial [Alphaproteobacteria bacterium]